MGTIRNLGSLHKQIRITKLQQLLLLIYIIGGIALIGFSLIYFALGYLDLWQMLLSLLVYIITTMFVGWLSLVYIGNYAKSIDILKSDRLPVSKITSDAVITVTPDRVITAWSSGSHKLFGFTGDDVIGQKLDMILSDESAGLSYEKLKAMSEDESIKEHVIAFRKKDGSTYRAQASLSLLKTTRGDVKTVVIIAQNISRELEIEEMLHKSQDLFKSLFESSTDGILRLEINGNILDCNRSICDMLGYKPEELKNLTCREITPPEWHSVDQDILKNQLYETGHTDVYTKQFKRKDSTLIPVSIVAWRLNEKDEPLSSWVIVKDLSTQMEHEKFVRDTIAHLERANERLQKLDKDKTEFVVMISHELQAPLATIASSVEALRLLHGDTLSSDEQKLQEILIRGVKRLSKLVDELLDITRIESGQLKLRFEPYDANKIVTGVVTAFQNRFSEKGLFLKSKDSISPCIVYCDPGRIEQVITNLLGNSLKFTEQGGVFVEVEPKENGAYISISDTGPGIPVEKMDDIFEKFYTSDTMSKGSQGMGLGLAISKGIVEAHGGRITAQNNNSAGVQFTVMLPWGTKPKESSTA